MQQKFKERFVRETRKATKLEQTPGLPPLKYDTINESVPEDWKKIEYTKLGNFYCGTMSCYTVKC